MVLTEMFDEFADKFDDFNVKTEKSMFKGFEKPGDIQRKKSSAAMKSNPIDFNFNPDIDLDFDFNNRERKDVTSNSNSGGGSGEGFDINLPGLPDIGLPELNIDMPDFEFDAPVIDIPDMPDMNINPDVSVPVNLDEAVRTAANITEQAIKPLAETAANAAVKIKEEIDKAMPNVDLNIGLSLPELNAVLPDVAKPVYEAFEGLKGDLDFGEVTAPNVVADNGSFGRMGIGDTGLAIDATDQINTLYSDTTSDTILEGTNAEDLFNVIDDPNKFLEDKANEVIENVGDSVIDGAGGVLVDLAKGATADKIARKIAEDAAFDATVGVVSGVANAIIPGSGVVITFVANVFKKGCFSGNTNIETPDGIKKACDVKIGDDVFTIKKGKRYTTRIVDILEGYNKPTRINTATRSIDVTNHPIYGRSWFRNVYYMDNILKTILPAFKTGLFIPSLTTRLLPIRKNSKLYDANMNLEKVTSIMQVYTPVKMFDFVLEDGFENVIGNGFLLWTIPKKYVHKVLKVNRFSSLKRLEK